MDLLIEFAVSWLLLWGFRREDPRVLGILPSLKRMEYFMSGFVMAAFICGFNYFFQTILSGSSWSLNTNFTVQDFFSGSWWNLHSVLYEELIFRGALLYLAISYIGIKRGCILSAICFGIYHWFAMNAFGNWWFMVYLFLGTGIMGYIFALAFAKTKSLYLPIGLHFGWNFVNNVIFSQGPTGNQLLILKVGDQFTIIENIAVVIISTLALPFCAFFYIRWINARKADVKLS
jgi:membrane protease YdiL (CAAX protease family)